MKKGITILFSMFLFIFSVAFSDKALAVGTTWNPSDKKAEYTLSNSNLTVKVETINGGIRATNYKTSGKYYWEVKIDSSIDSVTNPNPPVGGDYGSIGIANSNYNILNSTFTDINLFAHVGCNGGLYPSMQRYGIGFKEKDVVGIALDIDNHTIDYFINGTEQKKIDIPIWDKYYPLITYASSRSTSVYTANFGGIIPFEHSIPDGYLPYDESANIVSISLNKTTDTLQVGQTDALTATITPDDATNKTVTWKSSDESIAKVDSTGKVTAIKEGTVTITATTTDGSNLSASCTVNVTSQGTNPTDNSGNAILTITMTNGMEKEYDLPMTEVNKFVNWYNGRAAGTGNAYYTFNKNASLAAFTKRTEYILYDKILEFNVDQYTK